VAPGSVGDSGRIARVIVLLRLHHLGERHFDYLIPEEMAGAVSAGSIVTVPFGRRTARGLVVGTSAQADVPAEGLRAVQAVFPDRVPEELLDLARSVSDRYLCSLGACLRLVAPVASAGRRRPHGPARKDWVVLSHPAGPAAAPGAAADPPTRLSEKQRATLEAIPPAGLSKKDLCERAGVGRGVLKTLERKGLLEFREAPADQGMAEGIGSALETADGMGSTLATSDAGRSVGPGGDGGSAAAARKRGPTLWPEQERAVADLTVALDAPGFSSRLLWGVTGSGKTEVYLRLIEHAVRSGRGAILLVPEIALTPQTIDRVKGRFGTRVAEFHSGLPHGQRVREYRRVAAGEVNIVVGARSAVFAPVRDLGLIIIDEAHDPSYKQEEEPRYHVRTVAALRLGPNGGLLLEGSATPTVESMVRSEDRLRLSHRAAGSPPTVEVVDMRRQGAGLLLAPRSRDALARALRDGEQAIILLNRRGYAGYVYCDACGDVLMCQDCELSLTYHRRGGRLLCHHCGRTYPQPLACPKCGEAPLTRAAPGTERLDGELRAFVPGDRVFRMDSDVAGGGTRVQEILSRFAASSPGVLVGTQMVAKGHDFPGVTLVIVADADVGLYVPDFRASERTFQLLTQVAGRAGRAERPGRVLVQTCNPAVPCIRMALAGEEEAFYEEELSVRERLGYPPYAELIRLVTSSALAERAEAAGRHLVERLAPYFPGGELHGPAPLPRVRGRYRWQTVVSARQGERARTIIVQALAQLEEPYRRRGVMLLVDVDPLTFS
jgi:primosomal protein N' (replication factor Y) (superfamily II helicase)